MNDRPARLLATLIWLLAVPWLLFPEWLPVAAGLAAAALLLLPSLLRRATGHWLPPTPLDPFLLLYLGFTGVAFLVSPLPAVSLPKLLVVLLGVAGYYLAQSWLAGPPDLYRLAGLLAAAGAAIAVASPLALKWPERQVLNLQALTGRIPHLSGDFYIHHNELAGALLPLLPFALALWRRGDRLRLPAAAAAALMLAGLALTQSRSALLAIGLVAVAWPLWGRARLRTLAIAVGSLAGLALLFLALPSVSLATVSDEIARLDLTSKTGTSNAASWSTRLEIWRAAGRMLGDYPVVGAGLYTFEPVSRANYVYQQVGPDFEMAHAHNLLLETAVTLGWPGLVAASGLATALLAGLWLAGWLASPAIRPLAGLFAASAVAYLGFNLLDTLTLGQKPGLLIWLSLAGGAAVIRLALANQPLPLTLRRAGKLWGWAPPILLAVLLLSPAWDHNWANRQLDQLRLTRASGPQPAVAALAGDARRLGLLAHWRGDEPLALAHWQADPEAPAFLQSQGRLAMQSGELETAVNWFDLSLALDPGSAAGYFYRGQAHERLGELGLAYDDYQQANQFARASGLDSFWQAQTSFSWGRMLLHNGETEAALLAFRRAIALEPSVPWYYQGLGDALTVAGDTEGAAAAYRQAAERR